MRRLSWMLTPLAMSCAVGAEDAGPPATVSVTGTLQRAMGIGGETTGWLLRFDEPTAIGGAERRELEVDPGTVRIDAKLDGARVAVTGVVGTRQGIERGTYPVLRLTSVRPAEP